MIRHPRPTPDGELLRWPWGLWLFPVVPLAILLVSLVLLLRLKWGVMPLIGLSALVGLLRLLALGQPS